MESLTENKGLTRRQLAAIPVFAMAKSTEDGCRKSGVSPSCFYSWMKDEGFRSELEEARDRITSDALIRLKMGVGLAIDGLIALCQDPDRDTRRRSCGKLADLFFRAKETIEIEARLRILEEKIFK